MVPLPINNGYISWGSINESGDIDDLINGAYDAADEAGDIARKIASGQYNASGKKYPKKPLLMEIVYTHLKYTQPSLMCIQILKTNGVAVVIIYMGIILLWVRIITFYKSLTNKICFDLIRLILQEYAFVAHKVEIYI